MGMEYKDGSNDYKLTDDGIRKFREICCKDENEADTFVEWRGREGERKKTRRTRG